jgi:hypothetical protein
VLLAQGLDPETELMRGKLGKIAGLTVEETYVGPMFKRHQPKAESLFQFKPFPGILAADDSNKGHRKWDGMFDISTTL